MNENNLSVWAFEGLSLLYMTPSLSKSLAMFDLFPLLFHFFLIYFDLNIFIKINLHISFLRLTTTLLHCSLMSIKATQINSQHAKLLRGNNGTDHCEPINLRHLYYIYFVYFLMLFLNFLPKILFFFDLFR